VGRRLSGLVARDRAAGHRSHAFYLLQSSSTCPNPLSPPLHRRRRGIGRRRVVVYDALSRSEFQNGEFLPSVSSYTKPKVNVDGSIDIFFAPNRPKDASPRREDFLESTNHNRNK
jgi:hypothetical protein